MRVAEYLMCVCVCTHGLCHANSSTGTKMLLFFYLYAGPCGWLTTGVQNLDFALTTSVQTTELEKSGILQDIKGQMMRTWWTTIVCVSNSSNRFIIKSLSGAELCHLWFDEKQQIYILKSEQISIFFVIYIIYWVLWLNGYSCIV